jgi:hypothetical protein
VRTQQQRDDQTVVITIALLGLAVVTVVGILIFGLVARVTSHVDGVLDAALWGLAGILIAGLAGRPLGYLYRHRRP